ncbi:MAG TPA: hypothetical protein VLL51_04365 [Gemmatimonadales bacterium]|nr:hypothetical protein [Gemmatimonadales bacterium]
MRTLLALILIATLAGGCSRTPPATVDPTEPSYLEVQNQSFYDMTVYVYRGGARIRLGTVSGNSTQVFEIPRSIASPGIPVRFMADPIGGRRTPYTEEITILPGDTIVMRIPSG